MEYYFIAIVLMCILNRSERTVLHLNWMQTNDFHLIELLEIELFDYLTVSKQITDVLLNS